MIPFEWVSAAVVAVISLAAIWLNGRRSAKTRIKLQQVENRIAAVKQAKEIENEVQALDRDSLKRRASVWVRGSKR